MPAEPTSTTHPDAAAVRHFWQGLGLPGIFDVHAHFLPEAIQPVGVRVTNDGKKVFVFSDGKWAVIDIKEKQKLEKTMRTSEMERDETSHSRISNAYLEITARPCEAESGDPKTKRENEKGKMAEYAGVVGTGELKPVIDNSIKIGLIS